MSEKKETRPERRRTNRIHHRMLAQFESDGKSGRGVVLNMSEFGLFVETDLMIEPGRTVHLRVGSGNVIELQGKVVWSQKESAGEKTRTLLGLGVALDAVPPAWTELAQKLRKQMGPGASGRDQRFEVFHRVKFQSGEEFLTDYTENLSRGGMFLRTKEELSQGTTIRAQLEIPGTDQPLEIHGTVAYCLDKEKAEQSGRNSGVGVQFVELDANAKAKLHQYLKRLNIHRQTPERRFTGSIPASGSLSDFLVPELLLGILAEKRSGHLTLKSRNLGKRVFCKNGHPFYIHSTLRSETLGQYLVRQGRISASDVEKLLDENSSNDLYFGELLVKQGLVEASELARVMEEQQADKLINTFSWFDGTFTFSEKEDWPADISMIPLQTHACVFEGISRWYDGPLISAWMGLTGETGLARIQMPPQEAKVPPKAYRILHGLTEPKTIQMFANDLKVEPEHLLPTIYAMVISGWIGIGAKVEPAATKEKPVSRPVKMYKKEPEPLPEKELETLLKRVEEDFGRFSNLDFYELLGVTPDSNEASLQQAFSRLAGRYSLDDVERIPDEDVRNRFIQLRSWFHLAFDTLRDPKLREVYAQRGAKKKESSARQVHVEAERMLLAGIRDLQQGRLEHALITLQNGHQKYPEDAGIKGYLGWVLFQKDAKKNIDRALQLIREALDKEPSDPQLWYFRGQMAIKQNDFTRAERSFSKATKLHPRFTEAAAAHEQARDQRIAKERDTNS